MQDNGFTRRQFLQGATAAVLGAGAFLAAPWPALGASLAQQDLEPPVWDLEPAPHIKVLRWIGFVKTDEEIWMANTRRWETMTGGTVHTDYINWSDVRTQAAMEAAVGAGHDVVLGWFDDPHLYPDSLVDLSDVAEYLGARYGGWYPVCEVYGRRTGSSQWIALPICCPGVCMNYRASLVREAGFDAMPTTIEEFLACCKALKAGGHPTGFALGDAVGDANCWTHWWLWSFGGKAVEADGKTVAINSPESLLSLDAARELHGTMLPGVENWNDANNNRAFLDGEISVTSNGISILAAARATNPELADDIVIASKPIGPVGRPTELHLFSSAFVFRHSAAPNAAKSYLAFMLEQEQYGEWVTGTGGYNSQTLRAYRRLPLWEQDPAVTPFGDCLERMLWNGYAGPLGPASAAAMSAYVVVEMFRGVCGGERSPKDALLHAERKLAQLYAQG